MIICCGRCPKNKIKKGRNSHPDNNKNGFTIPGFSATGKKNSEIAIGKRRARWRWRRRKRKKEEERSDETRTVGGHYPQSYSPSMGVGHVDWSATNLRTRWDENLHQKWMTKHVAHTIILFFEKILIIQLRFGVKT